MGEKFVADNRLILSKQGLRFIRKVNTSYTGTEKFSIEWAFKGIEGSQDYKSEAERDAMYDQVKAALTAEKPKLAPMSSM